MTGADVIHRGRLSLGTMFIVAALAAPAWAQSASVEVGVGGLFTGAVPAGQVNASLLEPAGTTLRLFRTTNRIGSGLGAEGLVSMRLEERWRWELAVGWGRTDFESQISEDFEDVPPLTVAQKVNQYWGELAFTYRVVQRGRVDVFVRAGAGGFREITTDRALVDNGWRASIGGGTQFRLRQGSGWLGRLALRGDVRMQARGGGIAFGNPGTRLSPSVFAGLVIGQ